MHSPRRGAAQHAADNPMASLNTISNASVGGLLKPLKGISISDLQIPLEPPSPNRPFSACDSHRLPQRPQWTGLEAPTSISLHTFLQPINFVSTAASSHAALAPSRDINSRAYTYSLLRIWRDHLDSGMPNRLECKMYSHELGLFRYIWSP
jgi:hypothetical protein